jgi:hypothetical protein
MIAIGGSGGTEITGGISLTLGIGLEYVKNSREINSYIKGTTGVQLHFSAIANAQFSASIGAIPADVSVAATIDNYGEPLLITVGLDTGVNYYVSSNQSIRRTGFQVVSSFGKLVDQISVAVKGQVQATINAVFLEGLGDAFIRISISDINSMSRKPILKVISLQLMTHLTTCSYSPTQVSSKKSQMP